MSPEAREFLEEQFRLEQERNANRKENPKRLARQEAKCRKPMTVFDVITYANSRDIGVVHGGREGTYLIAPNGLRQPLSNHPGDLSTGMKNSAVGFIQQYGIVPVGA